MENTYENSCPWAYLSPRKTIQLLLFFIIWPFGAWLYSVFYLAKTRSAYIVFFLFSLLICWHFSPHYTDFYDDFLGILLRYETTHISTDKFLDIVQGYFSGTEGAEKELYEAFLFWFTRLITDNYHFHFFLAAVPVALCQLASMRHLTGDDRFRSHSILGVILLALFLLPRDIFTVQNYRFATGFWLAFYGTISFYCHNDNGRRYWPATVLILLAPLCHSGLLVYWGIFGAALFVKPSRMLEMAAMFSVLFTFFDANIFGDISTSFLPPTIQKWAMRYMSDGSYAKHILHTGRSGFWWVQSIFTVSMKLLYVAMTIQLIYQKKFVHDNREANALYPFFLVLFASVNLIQFVPVLGERYYWFTRIMCVFVWFKAFGFTKRNMLYYMLLACSFGIISRYGYFLGGALSVTTSPDLFYTPLPLLIADGFE